MHLDIRTLALLLAIVTMVTAVSLYLFYRLLPETPGLKQAAIGAACQSLGSIFSIARDFIPLELALVVSNGLYFFASAYFYQASRLLSNQKTEWRWPGIIILILLPPFLFFASNEYTGLRIILFSAGHSLLSFMTAWILLRNIPKQLPARRGAALAIGGIGLVSLYRLTNILFHPPGTAAFLDKSDDYLIFIWAIISAIIYAMAMIVMTSERLRKALKQQVKDLAVANKVADEALHEQKNFLAMLSHEFRTPLSIISANVDAINAVAVPRNEFISDSLNRVSNASTRLTGLVEGCLNDEWISNSIESGELKLSSLNLSQLLAALCDEYNVAFECDEATDIQVSGDPNLMTILFSSLIDNAKKYAATADGVKVSCHTEKDAIIVEVTDDGEGIPADEHERIFDKYYRAQSGNHRPGTGLGLFFVKRISKQHHGSVEIRQQNGTILRITLPRAKDRA